MIFEVTVCIVVILASRAIAKSYYRRRDVLYGPYRATTRCRRSKADEWSRQNFNQWDSFTASVIIAALSLGTPAFVQAQGASSQPQAQTPPDQSSTVIRSIQVVDIKD